MTESEIVEKVMARVGEFYMGDGDDSGEAIFNNWAKDYASVFEGDFESEAAEQKLEYTDAFNKYQALFEKHIERLITECDTQVDVFFAALKQQHEADPSCGFYVEMLLSVSNY